MTSTEWLLPPPSVHVTVLPSALTVYSMVLPSRSTRVNLLLTTGMEIQYWYSSMTSRSSEMSPVLVVTWLVVPSEMETEEMPMAWTTLSKISSIADWSWAVSPALK